MDNKQLFDAMALLAEPVMKAYKDDFYKHDKKVIEGLQVGDSLLWAPRECGSHLIVTRRQYRPNRLAREHYEGIRETVNWWLVTKTTDRCYLSPCNNTANVLENIDLDLAKGESVAELHL